MPNPYADLLNFYGILLHHGRMPSETPYPANLDLLTGHENRRANRCWRPRGTPVPLLIHTVSGSAVARVGGEVHSIGNGDTVLWSAGAEQDFECFDRGEPWQIIWAHFRSPEGWRDLLAWPALGPGVVRMPAPAPRQRDRVESALLEMVSVANAGSARSRQFALNALERAVLWLDAANPVPSRLDERVHEAVLYISSHLDRPLSVEELATQVQLSPSRLAHLFSEQLGIPPARFVELRRIERAQALLASTTLSVGAVAEATGFSSQFYFAHRYRALTGTTPSSWRARSRARS